jgi:hypothetical protein
MDVFMTPTFEIRTSITICYHDKYMYIIFIDRKSYAFCCIINNGQLVNTQTIFGYMVMEVRDHIIVYTEYEEDNGVDLNENVLINAKDAEVRRGDNRILLIPSVYRIDRQLPESSLCLQSFYKRDCYEAEQTYTKFDKGKYLLHFFEFSRQLSTY